MVEAGVSIGGKDVKQVKLHFHQYLCQMIF